MRLILIILAIISGIAGLIYLTSFIWGIVDSYSLIIPVIVVLVLILTVRRIRSVLRQGLRKLRDIGQGIRFIIIFVLKPKKLTTSEVTEGIRDVAITRTNVNPEEIAKDLKQFFIKKHACFDGDYCCRVHFDIERFSLSGARCRDWIRDELIGEYADKGIRAIVYPQRWAWSGLLADVGERINSEVIPIMRKHLETEQSREELAGKIRIRKNDRIIIVEPLGFGDKFLSQIITCLRNTVKADVFDTVCLFNVDIRHRQLPVAGSLLTLNLDVISRSDCQLCGMVPRLNYY